ncbi:hypothetical protein LSCM1_02572 [Leishmania martiniquensis]|uniref:Uncharacterized protein n=1 Tax=Leishmania martiniquensis TaxID=1580590 RepID=A0A836KD35_9TRYP|nr:hypothetical protein LSCM1_02572 [Leishmania martiniquensis]
MWMRFSRRLLFYIPPPSPAAAAQRVTPRTPPRHRGSEASGPASTNTAASSPRKPCAFDSGSPADDTRHSNYRRRPLCRSLRPGDSLPTLFSSDEAHGSSDGYTSQRQVYRQRRNAANDSGGAPVDEAVAGSLFTPLPRSYGFYDGIDEHAREAPRPSREERLQLLRESLEAHAASAVEFTDGGEDDVELNGLPADQYHGQAGWTTIPKDSALFNSMYGVGDLESRKRMNSWSVARRHCHAGGDVGELLGDLAAASAQRPGVHEVEGEQADQEVLDDRRRRRQHEDGFLSTSLEGELLAPMQESVGQPRSTYALRKLFVDGLVGYQGVITRAEEATMSEELLHLLQDARAAYIAEEARYCVNLYEKELGIPGKDTLAFALSRCETLQRVLHRFFFLGLIPSVPNVCQVSEMVGTFSGYPVHRHPPSIGSYVGVLNLVSTSLLHLQHKDAPWYPRLHLTPRSLFVVTEPCLSEYAMGYKNTHQPFHAFEYATRVSKDYRIEVLFATVETAQTRTLSEAVQLTEYAERRSREGTAKLLPGASPSLTEAPPHATLTAAERATGVPLRGRADEWLQRLRDNLHESEGARDSGHAKPLDGHALRRQLLSSHLVGERPRVDSGRSDVDGKSGAAIDAGATAKAAEAEGETMHGDKDASLSAKTTSGAQRRMEALKARYNFAQKLKVLQQRVEVTNDGPRLIRGHAPRDRRLGIK